jgi:cobalt-zinc-cadmium efflux system outer membrane protein
MTTSRAAHPRSLPVGGARLAVAGLTVVLAVGCVHYQPRPITAEATLDDFEARRLDAPELRAFLSDEIGINRWPPPTWDLQSLTLAALFYSPDLDAARARWGVTRAATITAGARPNPSLNPSLGYNSTSKLVSPWIPEAVLTLPIETAGKRGIRISQAEALSEAARLDVLHVAWVVRSRTRRAFVGLFRAREMEALLRRLHDIQVQSLVVLEAQLDVGAISANELTLARIAAGRSRLAALEAARDRDIARVQLAEALGIPTPALDGITIAFDALEQLTAEPPTDEMRRQAVTHRADVMVALAEYEATQAALQLEIAKQYPDIDIGAGYQLDQVDNKWTLGINLTLPVFNRNRGPIAEAEASRAEAAARFLGLQSRVLAEVDGAAASYRGAVETAGVADEMLIKVEQREVSAEAAYRLGAVSKLELLNSEIEIAAGLIARLESLVSAQQAAGDLEDALQNPLDAAEWVLLTPVRTQGVGEAPDEE